MLILVVVVVVVVVEVVVVVVVVVVYNVCFSYSRISYIISGFLYNIIPSPVTPAPHRPYSAASRPTGARLLNNNHNNT